MQAYNIYSWRSYYLSTPFTQAAGETVFRKHKFFGLFASKKTFLNSNTCTNPSSLLTFVINTKDFLFKFLNFFVCNFVSTELKFVRSFWG